MTYQYVLGEEGKRSSREYSNKVQNRGKRHRQVIQKHHQEPSALLPPSHLRGEPPKRKYATYKLINYQSVDVKKIFVSLIMKSEHHNSKVKYISCENINNSMLLLDPSLVSHFNELIYGSPYSDTLPRIKLVKVFCALNWRIVIIFFICSLDHYSSQIRKQELAFSD